MCSIRSSCYYCFVVFFFFFFKQKTAYEMRISDWSSDVCSSDLSTPWPLPRRLLPAPRRARSLADRCNWPAKRPLSSFSRRGAARCGRSEEHTSELQSLMRISYAVFCLKKKNTQNRHVKQTRSHTS